MKGFRPKKWPSQGTGTPWVTFTLRGARLGLGHRCGPDHPHWCGQGRMPDRRPREEEAVSAGTPANPSPGDGGRTWRPPAGSGAGEEGRAIAKHSPATQEASVP